MMFFDTMMRPETWIVITSLVALLWLNQRTVKYEAYRLGATQGFMLGIDRTIKVMREQKMISDDDQGLQLDKEELIIKLTPMITADVIAEMKRMGTDARK